MNEVRKIFPEAAFVATPAVVESMLTQGSPAFIASYWEPRFPGNVESHPTVATPLKHAVLELENQAIDIISLGHTDTDPSTALHLASAGLIVAGDGAYNDVHLFLAESTTETRREWLAALDTLDSLDPTYIVAGHKREGRPDSRKIIGETRRYIADFEEASAQATSADDLVREMLRLHPGRINAAVLVASAHAELSRRAE